MLSWRENEGKIRVHMITVLWNEKYISQYDTICIFMHRSIKATCKVTLVIGDSTGSEFQNSYVNLKCVDNQSINQSTPVRKRLQKGKEPDIFQ